jgi:PAS domain S-box-containing protein
MTLRAKASLLLAVIITLALGVTGFFYLRFLENSLRNSIFAGVEGVSSTSSEAIAKFLQDSLKEAQAVARTLPMEALERKDVPVIEAYLKALLEIFSKFENGMFILDADGILWADYPRHSEVRGRSFAFREYFQRTVSEGRGIIGVPYRSARTGQPVVTFTALLRGSSNQVLGLLGCSVQLLSPNALGGISKIRIGQSGYIYVYDTTRLMILHPRDERVFQRDVRRGVNKLFDAAIQGFEGVGETVNSRGIPMLLSVRRVPGSNWIVGAQQPKSEAFAPIAEARRRIIYGIIAAVLAADAVGALAIRRFTKPLGRLRAAVRHLGRESGEEDGELKKKERDFTKNLADIKEGDEIGDLAKAFRDMSQRLDQTMESLRSSARDWERTFDSVPDAVFILDNENRVLRLNRSAAGLWKVKSSEAIGQFCYKLMHGTDSPPDFCPHLVTIATGKPATVKVAEQLVRRTFEMTTTPLMDESGSTIGAVHLARDITEREQAEESLRKYEQIVSSAQDYLTFVDRNYVYRAVNDAYLRAYNKKREEVVGHTVAELFGQGVFEGELKGKLDRCLAGEQVRVRAWSDFPAFGRRYLDLAYYPFFDEGGDVSGIVVNARDITETKLLEDQLQQAQKMEAVGTLAGGIAHDFNNLLQAVQGYSELLLLDKKNTERGFRELKEIVRAAKRGAELTRRLLTFSRKVESQRRPVDLNHEVEQAGKLLARTIPKMIQIELRRGPALEIVSADPVQIEQVIMNLGVNAKDAMPERGRLVIETENVTLSEEFCRGHLGLRAGRYVLLSVTDTGHGMDKEVLEHIFEPFYSTKGPGKGTGLGLAMVYGIIRSHEGYITCSSEPGQGTCFRIYLPVVDHEPEMLGLRETEASPRGGTETILLVDDEEPIRELGSGLLGRFGYKVLIAGDGETALELYREGKAQIDLVILDLIMPGMGGKRCLEELIRMNPEVKVLISSGFAGDHPEGKTKQAGAKGFIKKPFDLGQILRAVRDVLDGSVAAREWSKSAS